MMTEGEFDDLVDRIMKLGFDEDTAAKYAGQIGDLPVHDKEGRTLVRNAAGETVKLNLKW